MSSRASKELKGGAAHVKKQQDSFSVSPLGSSKGKVFHIDTIHISSKSDPYLDDKYDYGGIIIYAFKGKGEKEWCPIVEKNHGIGYVVIMQTNSVKFKELQKAWPREPGKVHGIIFREAFEESFNKMNVVGEGFSIISGIFQTVSGVFNPSHGGIYHDESRKMHSVSAECVGKVVKKWKEAGGNFRARNYSVAHRAGYININWKRMEKDVDKITTKVKKEVKKMKQNEEEIEKGVIALANRGYRYVKRNTAAATGFAGGFLLGLTL